MNILMVTEQFLFGGLETQIRDQIDYLVKCEHRVYLAVGRFSNQSISDLKLSGIIRDLNIGLESKVEDLIKTVDLISGFIENNNINVIHAHPFLSLLPAFLASAKTHVPMVITLHGPVLLKSSIGFGNLHDKLLRAVILPYVNHVFCVSEEMRALAKLYVKEENVTILRNTVSLSLFKPARRKNDGTWALISRLDGDKIEGIIQFILMAENVGINCVHLFGDGHEKASLERFVSEKIKKLSIEFKGVSNNLNEVLIEGYFGIAGMGRVVLEGAALNLPTILVGYDGVKGFLDEPLMENAKWWNYSGRGLSNVDDQSFAKTLVELQSNIDMYLLRNWSEVNSNSNDIWSKYLKTIMELDANQNEFPTGLLELFKAHIGSNKPFLFDRDLYFDMEDFLIKYSIGSGLFAEKRITFNILREERDEALMAKARIEQDRQRLLKDNAAIEQDRQRSLRDNAAIEQDRQRSLRDNETIERDRQRLLREIAGLEKNVQLQKEEINRIYDEKNIIEANNQILRKKINDITSTKIWRLIDTINNITNKTALLGRKNS